MAKKTKDKVNGTVDASIPDVRDQLYPEGVPTNDDGSVASAEEISVEEARRAGAVNPESAQYNRAVNKKINRKLNGEKNVPWGETNALEVFDLVKRTFNNTAIIMNIQRTSPETMDFAPLQMSHVRTSADFYERLMKTVHKNTGPAKYFIRFKEANGSERGRGYLDLPDNTEGAVAAAVQQQPQQPAWPSGPPGYYMAPPGAPPMPPPGMPPPYGYPQPVQPYPMPIPGPVAAPPPPTPPVQVQPPAPPPAPTPSAPSAPAAQDPRGYDPYTAAIYDQVRRLEGEVRQSNNQLLAALATIEEFKRHQAYFPQAPVAAVASQPAPVAQQLQRFCSSCGTQQATGGRFCIQCGVPQMPIGGPVSSLPSQAPAPIQVAPAQNPLESIQASVGMLSGLVKAVSSFRSVVNNELPEEEEDEPVPAVQVQPPPFRVQSLGAGVGAPTVAYGEDGAVNVPVTVMSNLNKVGAWVKEAADGVKTVLDTRAQRQQQAPAPYRPPPAQPQPVAAPPPPPPSPPAPFAAPPSSGLVPPMSSYRQN